MFQVEASTARGGLGLMPCFASLRARFLAAASSVSKGCNSDSVLRNGCGERRNRLRWLQNLENHLELIAVSLAESLHARSVPKILHARAY